MPRGSKWSSSRSERSSCRQLGGPCDLAHTGKTADAVIQAQDAHLKDAVAHGSAEHQEAADAMAARWKNPIKGMGWYLQAKKDFKALPEA